MTPWFDYDFYQNMTWTVRFPRLPTSEGLENADIGAVSGGRCDMWSEIPGSVPQLDPLYSGIADIGKEHRSVPSWNLVPETYVFQLLKNNFDNYTLN